MLIYYLTKNKLFFSLPFCIRPQRGNILANIFDMLIAIWIHFGSRWIHFGSRCQIKTKNHLSAAVNDLETKIYKKLIKTSQFFFSLSSIYPTVKIIKFYFKERLETNLMEYLTKNVKQKPARFCYTHMISYNMFTIGNYFATKIV